MPTYDYECGACGHVYEMFQSITAKPVKKCPLCGKPKAKRLIGTGGALIFRGSGFYCTDYRSDSYKSAAKAESGTPAAKTGGDGDKTGGETAKPAAASAPKNDKGGGSKKADA